jgi:hypothetical protein
MFEQNISHADTQEGTASTESNFNSPKNNRIDPGMNSKHSVKYVLFS